MWKARALSLIVILALFVFSFSITSVLSQNVTSQSIQTQGEILYASPSPPQTQLRVNGLYLEDGSGNRVRLKGIQVAWNGRMKVEGSTGQMASTPDQSWFTLSDVQRMKNAGSNVLEIGNIDMREVMPTKNVPNEGFFSTWIDTWVNWCTQNQMYCILTIGSPRVTSWGATPVSWMWQGIYSTPATKADYDQIIRDFFDTSVSKQDSNRAAWINLCIYMANRYKSNPYVLFGSFNEPFNFVDIPDTSTAIHLAQTYSTFMEQIVDGIRSTGSQQLVIIDAPFLWDSNGWYVVQPVNKANIIWEDHMYVTDSTTFASWQNHINSAVQYFVNGFGKPLFIGEYGFDPPTITHTTYAATWTTILSNEVAYLDSSQLAGRQWYAWDYLYGEYDVAEGSSDFTAAESTWIIQTVLG